MSEPLAYHRRRVLDLGSFLSRFEHVSGGHLNAKGEVQYHAWCPAHETHHQGLGIAVAHDGRYLLNCHAGCSAAEVCAAVGLSLADLYPDGAMMHRMKSIQPPNAVQVDRAVLEIAQATRAAGGRLSKSDLARERQAWAAQKRDRSWPKGSRDA